MTSTATGAAAEYSAAKPVAKKTQTTKNARKSESTAGPRAFLHRMHTVAGILIAPLLLIATISGLAYAAAPAMEKVVYHEEMTATSQLPAQPIEKQVDVARKLHPDLEVSAVQVPEDPDKTTRVLFEDPTLKSSSYRHAVFVDPGDLSVKGDLVQYGSSAALPLRAWISEGHRRLWMGDIGRLYSETAASWMGALTLTGLWLWWDRIRRGRHKGESKRGHHMRRHARVGAWLSIGLLFLTATGLTWSMVAGAGIAKVRESFDWYAPTPAVVETVPSSFDWAEANGAVQTARMEGLTGKLEVTPPSDSQSWVVMEAREEWRTGKDTVAVDGASGDVVDHVHFADWPIAAKLTEWTINAHMGILFGWVNQLALAVVAIGLGAMIMRGYAMWFGRGRAGRPGRMPVPVRWRDIRPSVLATIVVALVAYSLVAPLFGVTLVLFAAVDFAWRRLTQRQP